MTGRRQLNPLAFSPCCRNLLLGLLLYNFLSNACANLRTSFEVVIAPRTSPGGVWQRNGLALGRRATVFKSKRSFLVSLTSEESVALRTDRDVSRVSSVAFNGPRAGEENRSNSRSATGTELWPFDTPVIDLTIRRYCKSFSQKGQLMQCRDIGSSVNETKSGGSVNLKIVSNKFYDEAGGESATSVADAIRNRLDDANEKLCGATVEIKPVTSWERVFEISLRGGLSVCKAVDFVMNTTGIARIEFANNMKLLNNFATSVGQSGQAGVLSNESAIIWKEGLMGEGEVVAVGDSGLDLDSCYFRETTSAAPEFEGCDMSREKIVCYVMGANAEFGDTSSKSGAGHGTHTAGSVAGFHVRALTEEDDRNRTVTFHELMASSAYSNGQAPLARLAIMDIDGELEDSVDAPADFARSTMFTVPYEEAGVRLHTNSWGCASAPGLERFCNKYDTQTRSIDEFMWNNKDFLVLFAAGNEGTAQRADVVENFVSTTKGHGDTTLRNLMSFQDGFWTVGSPATFKNGISVGASRSGQDENFESLYYPSSRGPTMDQRIKPDLVFPGEAIRSAYSSGNPTDFAEGLCGKQHYDNSKSTAEISGTSMACPGLAGISALVRQYYREFNPVMGKRQSPMTGPLKDGKGPSASLIKATLISSARSLDGVFQYHSEATGKTETARVKDYANPRFLEGFGLPSLNNTLHFSSVNSSHSLQVFDRHSLSKTGEAHRFTFSLRVGSSFKATLVYTDPPGPVTDAFDPTPVLINDLDLTASCNPSACETVTLSDASSWQSVSRVDNVEQIPAFVSSTATFKSETNLTLVVIAQDLVQGPQPYALVVSGQGIDFDFVESQKTNWKPDWGAKAVVPGLFSSSGFDPKIAYACLGVIGVAVLLLGLSSMRVRCMRSGVILDK